MSILEAMRSVVDDLEQAKLRAMLEPMYSSWVGNNGASMRLRNHEYLRYMMNRAEADNVTYTIRYTSSDRMYTMSIGLSV